MGYWKHSHSKIAAVRYCSENEPRAYTCSRVGFFYLFFILFFFLPFSFILYSPDLAIQHHPFQPYHYPIRLFIKL